MNDSIKYNIVTLKWGDTNTYTSKEVNELYTACKKYCTLPFNFVCYTERPEGIDKGVQILPLEQLQIDEKVNGIIYKLAVLHNVAGLQGRCLFLDLDLVITDNIDCFFQLDGDFRVIHNWIERRKTIVRKRPNIGNTSVYRYEAGKYSHILEDFLADPEDYKNYPTEQAYMSSRVPKGQLQWWPETWVRSFKYNTVPIYPTNYFRTPKMPLDTKILVFHGAPKMQQAVAGWRGNYTHKFCKPFTQLSEYWPPQ